ncbi:MAG TPA: NAD(P)-binding protein [Acidimicrobiales bacterium]|nr:NAD(P)-binding protein [Acidimicrobiales bacterium]
METDYLVVGAGAAGMAFADALVAGCDVDVVLVDRRDAPGGHWNDAYPFVRLHQPSATYGVPSLPLGTDSLDTDGSYERATGMEVCDYFRRVLEHRLLPTGRVRFEPMCDFVGSHTLVSRLTGRAKEVRVRRRVVDTTYLEVSVPATHTPGFTVDPDARVIPVGKLAELGEAPAGYTVLGGGKTAMDACTWLLDHGVDPERIRWVRPREAWLIDRAFVQPLDLLPATIDGFSRAVEALAAAHDARDLFDRLEDGGHLFRLDASVEPTMFRGAILSRAERDALQRIERVVRQGRVRHVGTDRIAMEDGEVPTSRGEVHVDCTASGFRTAPARPIFEPGRIVLQSLMGGFTTFNAALVGFVEATRGDDTEKNRLCPPTPQPDRAVDWVSVVRGSLRASMLHAAEADLMAWREGCRLSLTRGMGSRLDDPLLQSAMARWGANMAPAVENADRLLAQVHASQIS